MTTDKAPREEVWYCMRKVWIGRGEVCENSTRYVGLRTMTVYIKQR